MTTETERALHFRTLGPDQVMSAVEGALGKRCTGEILALNSYENRVYRIGLASGERVIGKFYRPDRWDQAALKAAFTFIFDLAEAGVQVARPLELAQGGVLGRLDSGIAFAVFEEKQGRQTDELDEAQLRQLGRALGRLHRVGQKREAPSRPRLDVTYFGRRNLDDLERRHQLPPEIERFYLNFARQLVERIAPMFEGVPMQRIHGDCHRGNWLWSGDQVCFIDFDDFGMGPQVQDLFMACPSIDREGQEERAILLQGYREVCDFDPRWLQLCEPLRALRFIHYSSWIARRYADPAFVRMFPQFGTLRYWQEALADLREQWDRIESAADHHSDDDAYNCGNAYGYSSDDAYNCGNVRSPSPAVVIDDEDEDNKWNR